MENFALSQEAMSPVLTPNDLRPTFLPGIEFLPPLPPLTETQPFPPESIAFTQPLPPIIPDLYFNHHRLDFRDYQDETDSKTASPNPRLYSSSPRRKSSTPWDQREDLALLQTASEYKNSNWAAVAKKVNKICGLTGKNARSADQCSQRFYRVLNPNINKGVWNEDEITELVSVAARFKYSRSKPWKRISSFLRNRSEIQVRYKASALYKMALKGKSPLGTNPQEIIDTFGPFFSRV